MEAAARMTAAPRVLLGLPAYDRPDVLARTLESLASQTFRDFALVIVDDAPTAAVRAIVESYEREFPRLIYEANATRLGMVDNWRRVFERARQLHPASEYFAWVSDHDLWHRRWLEVMVETLDRHPAVVLAYSRNVRMLPDDARLTAEGFHTTGVTHPGQRMQLAARHLLAGDMIYGLVRADALARAGVFRRVVTPDRQVLLALSLFGQFAQVPEVLWYREQIRGFDLQRQRDVFSPGRSAWHMYLPSHLQHFATLVWDFGVRGRGRPAVGRVAGARAAVSQLWWSSVRQLTRPKSGWRLMLARFSPAQRVHSTDV
jgi:glycosyltransferase involved in cell wall biosynthesis